MSDYTELIPFKPAFERLKAKKLLTVGDVEFLEALGILKRKKGRI